MYFPPSVNRASAVETLGEELGLRIRDSAQGNEPLVVNCLNEAVVEKALTLDGLVFNNPGGHPGGKISVQRVKSLPLGAKELMAMVDALVWGEYEVQRMSQPLPPRRATRNPPIPPGRCKTRGSKVGLSCVPWPTIPRTEGDNPHHGISQVVERLERGAKVETAMHRYPDKSGATLVDGKDVPTTIPSSSVCTGKMHKRNFRGARVAKVVQRLPDKVVPVSV